ncbi:MAG: hypothetical protein QNK16_07465 [Woeseiaceae bacterium]|nr:hypothetical protein [Woeseiaceae bacterium]MDX2608203.1 hypothetical protein [Woeseiaceae bacterium]
MATSIPELGRNTRLSLALMLAVFVQMPAAIADDTPVTPSSTDREFIEMQTSINAIMIAMMDWSAHEIWETSYMETMSGRSWQATKRHATELLAAATLVSLGGTGRSDDRWARDPAWQEWTALMIAETKEALSAIEAQDQFRLVASGERLVEACDGCHQDFRPKAPPEGLMHVPHNEYGDPLARD